jgi:hypothetical protein
VLEQVSEQFVSMRVRRIRVGFGDVQLPGTVAELNTGLPDANVRNLLNPLLANDQASVSCRTMFMRRVSSSVVIWSTARAVGNQQSSVDMKNRTGKKLRRAVLHPSCCSVAVSNRVVEPWKR